MTSSITKSTHATPTSFPMQTVSEEASVNNHNGHSFSLDPSDALNTLSHIFTRVCSFCQGDLNDVVVDDAVAIDNEVEVTPFSFTFEHPFSSEQKEREMLRILSYHDEPSVFKHTIESLNLREGYSSDDLKNVLQMASLVSGNLRLDLRNCPLAAIEPGSFPPGLSLLKISNIDETYLQGILERCPKLKALQVSNGKMLTSIDRLGHSQLQTLSLKHHHNISSLPDFSKFPNLRSLSIEGCDATNFPSINAPKLQKLYLKELFLLTKFPSIKCPSLFYLSLDNISCSSNFSLKPCKALKHLSINTCHGFTDLPDISRCRSLLSIKAHNCPSLRSSHDLSITHPHLHQIEFVDCAFPLGHTL